MGPGWGEGEFSPKKPMLRVGEPFRIDEFWSGSEQDFNVLATDSMWLWNSGTLVYNHQTPGEPAVLGSDQRYRLKVDPYAAFNDMNYVTADGAARTLRGVTRYDRRITLGRKPGPWGWAWVLPAPE